jgi:uncharacterized membrane protein YgcG
MRAEAGQLRGAAALVLSALVLLAAALGSPLAAREEIILFESAIEVGADGALVVEETITVRATGRDIRRGIYRDLPIRYQIGRGLVRHVGFRLLDVSRDGRAEPHFTERTGDHVRIYAGEQSVLLSPGEYTYTFRYRTTRQLRHFEAFDEVYWNVTGNFWSFPITKAIATVTLPEGAEPVQHAAYTGRFGESRADYTARREGRNTMVFETTRTLAPREGLTIAVAFPKGVVAEPGAALRLFWSVWDNVGLLILGLSVVATATYFYTTWDRVGRDPQKGLIIPMFAPPAGLSPAAVSYVHFQGFSTAAGGALRAFIAALMSLAVKKRIRIDDQGGTVALTSIWTGTGTLPGGEAAIMTKLLPSGWFEFTKANGEIVRDAQHRFRSAILKEHEGVFFRNNYGYFVVGAIISVAALAAFVLLARPDEETLVMLVAIFVAAVAGAFVISMGTRRILGWVPGGGSTIFGVLLTFAGTFVLVAGAGVVIALGEAVPSIAAAAIVAIACLNVTFFHLLRAPTIVGRKVMDEIEGFRLYLSVAEAEWMNMRSPQGAMAPEMSADLFEAYLPYAVALGVEKPWSDAFQSHMARIMPGRDPGTAYRPTWYHGNWSSRSLERATTAMVSSISSSVAASMPSSSGSGGGGSSGGGGGGGGGGW